MAGRAAVLAWEEAKAANPCILGDHQGAYEYGGMKYELVAHPSGASFDACSKLVKMVLRQNLECGAPQVYCLRLNVLKQLLPTAALWLSSALQGHDVMPLLSGSLSMPESCCPSNAHWNDRDQSKQLEPVALL